MAKKTVTTTECDRCHGTINEVPLVDFEEFDAAEKVVLYVERVGKPSLNFSDLCNKCSERVDNLLEQMRLAKESKKARTAKTAVKPEEKAKSKDVAKAKASDKKKKGKTIDFAQTAPPSN